MNTEQNPVDVVIELDRSGRIERVVVDRPCRALLHWSENTSLLAIESEVDAAEAGALHQLWEEHTFTQRDVRPVSPTRAIARGAEPLTIAYVAMGAQQAISAMPGGCLPNAVAARFDGQIDFIGAVIADAWRLDAEWEAREAADEDLRGVFPYDIAEPYGELMAAALARGETPDAQAVVQSVFESMTGPRPGVAGA